VRVTFWDGQETLRELDLDVVPREGELAVLTQPGSDRRRVYVVQAVEWRALREEAPGVIVHVEARQA
jgi:hypothetical protein